jgi:hypothetical protein
MNNLITNHLSACRLCSRQWKTGQKTVEITKSIEKRFLSLTQIEVKYNQLVLCCMLMLILIIFFSLQRLILSQMLYARAVIQNCRNFVILEMS